MSLYITRHGETDYNIKELVCGISEAMLSDKGIKQAQKLADLLRNKGIGINLKQLLSKK